MTRRALVFATVLSLLLTTLLSGVVSAEQRPLPNSMAAAGDSITRAFNTCRFPFVDCPANSWSTGTSTTVNSHYNRILNANRQIRGKNYNDAKSGAKMADLPGQMRTISGRNVQYVTVQMGGNDVCTPSLDAMTSVVSFEASFRDAMDTISANPAVTTVYVTSVPDVHRLWEIFHANASALATWDRYDVCQSLLANATSTAAEDAARRSDVRERNIEFNTILEAACADYAKCVWDGWSVFCTEFTTSDVSSRDYFHPSVSGQQKFADVTWRAGPFVPSPSVNLGSDCA